MLISFMDEDRYFQGLETEKPSPCLSGELDLKPDPVHKSTMPSTVKNILHHLSALLGQDITIYKSRYFSEKISLHHLNDEGYICSSVAENMIAVQSTQYLLYAPKPSKIINSKWSTAFMPLSPLSCSASNCSDVEGELQLQLRATKSSAKREASLKRIREESGKFKRCQTKWVPVTSFYNIEPSSLRAEQEKDKEI